MAKPRFRKLKQGKSHQERLSKGSSQTTPSYATTPLKIKAFLTDAFMLLMPIMYVVFYLVMDGREDFAAHKLEGWVFILVPYLLIQTIFFYVSGQTPGYRAYDLILIEPVTHKRPSLFAIIFRNLSAILSLLTLFGWLIMFFRKDHKGLHDLLSATMVVQKS